MTNNLGRSEYDLKVKFNHVIGGILSARKNMSHGSWLLTFQM